MRVDFITFFAIGRAAVHHELAARTLAKEGYDVRVHAPVSETPPIEGRTSQGFHVQVTGAFAVNGSGWKGALGKLIRQVVVFLKVLRWRLRSDGLLYLNSWELCPGAWMALWGHSGKRVIYHSQNFLEPARYRVRCWFEARLARKAGLVIINEVHRARFMQSYYRLRRPPLVLPTALPKDWPLPDRTEQLRREVMGEIYRQDACLILHQGPYSEVRMSRQLLAALAYLPARYALAFTGMEQGSRGLAEMKECAQRYGVEHRIICHPYVPFEELGRFATAADIGVLLYPNDGIGNFFQAPGRLTEYAAGGLPFVASNFPVFENLSLKYGIGVVCDPYDPGDIAKALRGLGEVGEAEAQRRRVQVRKVFVDHLAYEHSVGKLLAAVRELAGAGCPDRRTEAAQTEHGR